MSINSSKIELCNVWTSFRREKARSQDFIFGGRGSLKKIKKIVNNGYISLI